MKKSVILFSFLLTISLGVFGETLVGFSKQKPSAKEVVLKAIGDSTETLDMAVYYLTEKQIVQALIAAKKRGVAVRVVLDRTQQDKETQSILVKEGIPCFVDDKHKIMHHKFTIIDRKHVQTGSLNFTTSGDKVNAENAIYIKDDLSLAKAFQQEFERVYKGSVPCSGNDGEK